MGIGPMARLHKTYITADVGNKDMTALSADGKYDDKSPITDRPESTLLFRGQLPNDISDITNAANDMISDIDYIEWIENRRWNIQTTGGITIKLPEHDFVSAIASLITIDKTHNLLGRDIRVIDMRDPARILVK